MVNIIQRRKLDKPINEAWLINELRNIASGKLAALWLPSLRDDTVAKLSPDGLVWTYANPGGLTPQGHGILVSFNGTDQYVTTPDTDDLSFGDGTTDSPFSLVALANVTNTADNRTLIGRWVSEYTFRVSTGDKLEFIVVDASSGGSGKATSTASVVMGEVALFGGSYNPAIGNGATAGNGVTVYQNGTEMADSKTNEVAYVAMENGTTPITVGRASTSTDQYMQGSMGFVAIYAAALTIVQHARIAEISRRYYGIKL